MAYIGREPQVGNFQVCDAISVVNGQAAYTMQVSSVNVSPETANHMLVSLNGVLQAPGSSYTVSGERISGGRRVRDLQTGQYVNIEINNVEMYAYILSDRGGVYAIQPRKSGGVPSYTNRRTWQKISNYSWEISGGDFNWLIPVSLNNMDDDDAEPVQLAYPTSL